MSEQELAVIKERAEKATDGPWFVSDGKDVATEVFYRGYSHSDVDVIAFSDGRINAEFIANARQDVPKLVAEVERLQAILSECESLLSEAHDVLDDVHCYETDTYVAITKYFYGDDDE